MLVSKYVHGEWRLVYKIFRVKAYNNFSKKSAKILFTSTGLFSVLELVQSFKLLYMVRLEGEHQPFYLQECKKHCLTH